jgi:hypothetical protein
MLNGNLSIVLTLETAEAVHARVLADAGTPTVTLAVTHALNIDIAPVGTATRVTVIAADGK